MSLQYKRVYCTVFATTSSSTFTTTTTDASVMFTHATINYSAAVYYYSTTSTSLTLLILITNTRLSSTIKGRILYKCKIQSTGNWGLYTVLYLYRALFVCAAQCWLLQLLLPTTITVTTTTTTTTHTQHRQAKPITVPCHYSPSHLWPCCRRWWTVWSVIFCANWTFR